MALKVLMMGGRRCGKTSVLTSLFYQSIHGAIKKHFTISDATKVQERDGERIESLCNKRLKIINYIEQGEHNTFLADQAPTQNFWDYKLKVQVPGTNRYMEIIFRDSAGEFFEEGNQHYNETINYIKDCDVFIVVVDTPYLMAGTTAEKNAANVVDPIHTFLTHMDTSKAKQVIFVPVKCEKWVKEGKIDKVTAALEELYSTTITSVMAYQNIEVSIIPVETAGDIIFEELREPYILNDPKNKCSKRSDRLVVLKNGENYRLTDKDVVQEDPEGIFPDTNITRRAAWYSLRHEPKAEYTPHNCEQIPLHILRFMFNKQDGVGGLLGWFLSIFGSITKNDITRARENLQAARLIKNSGEGIKILKSCFLNIPPQQNQ